MRKLFFVLIALCPAFAVAQNVSISLLPERPIIERGRHDQRLNFDFLLTNGTPDKLEIEEVELTVRDDGGTMLWQHRVGWNGESITTLPNRTLDPGAKIVVFNPLFSFPPELPLKNVEARFTFAAGEQSGKYVSTVSVHPREYSNKVKLQLPVGGRVYIHDGHDFLAHHRRLDVTGPMTTALGIRTNLTRYAYDFCVVDEKGSMYRGDGSSNEQWYGFGVPVYAPGVGTVVEAVSSIPDNTKDKPVAMDREEVMKNVKRIMGNYVIIDHGNGEFSLLAHLKQGSVTVKPGQRVKAGEQIGAMGFSGDAFLVHLHYELQSDSAFGEGLPSYFPGVKVLAGSKWIPAANGQIDSGDVVTR